MTANETNVIKASTSFCKNSGYSLDSECKCSYQLKGEVQYLKKEIRSMNKIINILKEELKYDGGEGHKGNTNSGSAKKTSYNNTQCRNCVKRENKLKETTNNLSSMTLISEILGEEIRDMKQETHVVSNINNDNRWQSVKTNKLSQPNSAVPSRKEQISHGILSSRHYMVPVNNRYTMLSRHQDELTTNEVSSPSNTRNPAKNTRFRNFKRIGELQSKKTTSIQHLRSSVPHLCSEHNPQSREGSKSESESVSEIHHIPTIINGLTKVHHTTKSETDDKIQRNC